MLENLHPGSFAMIWAALVLIIIGVLGLFSAPSALAHLKRRWRRGALCLVFLFLAASAAVLCLALIGRI